jgi:predicted DNA-binding transcriptional regulator YafY
MIAWSGERNDYLTFALDRIQSMQAIAETQRFRQDFDPSLFLKHSIGIMESNQIPEKVQLHIRAPYHALLKLEPLHLSQQITQEDQTGMRIQLIVQLNEELHHRILSYGPFCEVLEPEILRKTVSELLHRSIELYKQPD